MTTQYTAQHIQEMKDWLADCVWQDVDSDDIQSMSNEQIIKAVKRHYHGGVDQFIADGLEIPYDVDIIEYNNDTWEPEEWDRD